MCVVGCMMENIKNKSPLAKADRFLSRLEVIRFELQNRRTRNRRISK